MNKSSFKPIRKFHKLAGYLLALQLFAWLLGGLVMSAIPLDMVHGKHLAKRTLDNPFTYVDYTANLNQLADRVAGFNSLTLSHFLDQPMIIATGTERTYFTATGAPFPAPSEAQIRANARAHFLGDSPIDSAHLLVQGPREVQYRPRVWQVTFADTLSTTLYLDAHSGQVITVRSSLWRIFDFFWMLHIMDYDERDDFNNPLLITFAASSVAFCLSGMLLLLQSPPWRRRRQQGR
ncbi:hypothetical protein [Pseudoalteromonas viridis]|uniref:PepSY domain-containing protein n=1 Tax=Pseudoalteromonas viridis TaxID=339617 RepID=A0ABX7VAM1_9GAMM|nr:hypothetical protein [Pseudoalteromonas viridis]QTL36245.1 hypothetical protein J5X90_04105 [Pseudoalteromonas viridis]